MTNVVVLCGRLTRPAALRSLPSGDQLVALEVSIRREGERAETAPVVWPGAPASAATLDLEPDFDTVHAKPQVKGHALRPFVPTSP